MSKNAKVMEAVLARALGGEKAVEDAMIARPIVMVLADMANEMDRLATRLVDDAESMASRFKRFGAEVAEVGGAFQYDSTPVGYSTLPEIAAAASRLSMLRTYFGSTWVAAVPEMKLAAALGDVCKLHRAGISGRELIRIAGDGILAASALEAIDHEGVGVCHCGLPATHGRDGIPHATDAKESV